MFGMCADADAFIAGHARQQNDPPLVTHDRIIPELEGLLELKLANSNLDLLKCLTINGANLIGDEKLGRIQEGCYADFVITKGNPLDDIHNIMNPMVVLNGDVVRG